MPVLATFFTVRRGRDPFFKFFMQKLFPKQVDRYEKDFGMRFLGWYNVAYGWDFDNVILLELPDYETIDKLEGRPALTGHRPPGRESGCSSVITPCSCASGWAPTWSSIPDRRVRPPGA